MGEGHAWNPDSRDQLSDLHPDPVLTNREC
jgi:hypothetical protein